MSYYILRHYQADAMGRTLKLISGGAASVLNVAPTGSGKTVLACHLISEFQRVGWRTLFLAHRDELVSQCCEKLRENSIAHGIIKAGMGSGDLHARVHVAGVQTFAARIKFMRSDYRLIIVDEAHHARRGSLYDKIIDHCKYDGVRPVVIGLTATPYRLDGAALGDVFAEMVTVASTAQLCDEGYLVPPRVFRAQTPDLQRVGTFRGDYDESELAEAMNKIRITGHAINEYLRLARGLRNLVFCVNRAHMRAVTAAYQAAGIEAEYLDGETPTAERRAKFARFHDGKTLALVTVGVATEGFDEPRIETIQTLRPTMSRCLWRQAVGRGARPCEEIYKRYFLLLDHAGWTERHGYLTDPDIVSLKGGLAKGRPRPVATCPRCAAVLASRPRLCPACGLLLSHGGEKPDTIGLGDASFTLEEDAPFFGRVHERPEPAAAPYIPAAPNPYRIARRARGL